MKTLVVMPAYGRDYHLAQDAWQDWCDGKDFKIIDGPYVGIGEKDLLVKDGYRFVCIKFNATRQSLTFGI